MRPLVSIITVTRNLLDAGRADFFRQCVESVHMQDYPNIEHLIIDGASTDGTLDLFQELGVPYVSEPDSGVYNAFNKGLKRANGQYIAFLNSDDFYTRSDSVSSFITALENEKADFTCGPVDIVADGQVVEIRDVAMRACFRRMPFCHQTMFARVEVLRSLGGFNEEYRVFSDFDLILRALLSGRKIICLDAVLVAFREGGVSWKPDKEILSERVKIIETDCHVSYEQASRAQKYGFLPKKILMQLLSKMVDFPDEADLLKYHSKNFFKFVRKQIFTLRLRRGKRCFRLFGITFYDEEKK